MTEQRRSELAALLVARIGGYLPNAVRSDATCAVCSAPVDGFVRCYQCNSQLRVWSEELADLVVPLAYGGHNEQSRILLYGYKDKVAESAGDERRDTVMLMLLAAVGLHRSCIEKSVGRKIGAAVVVPSTQGRDHPLPSIAKAVLTAVATDMVLVDATAGPVTASQRRTVTRDRFTLVNAESLEGQHVLVIDDTWVGGNNAQSMALAVRDAGASHVTILVLARWLDPKGWHVTADFLAHSKLGDFDAHVCPVTGDSCP